MYKILILGVIGVVFILLLRLQKETKNYRINERESSLYIDTTGTSNEYLNSNQIINNRYEH
jgi:hypothetical protein